VHIPDPQFPAPTEDGASPMTTDPDTILLEAEESMAKALTYLGDEFKGIRAGRATPALVEYVKVDYYGSMTDLKNLANISTPEPTQLLIKPFDAGAVGAIKEALEKSGLGFNPQVEAKQIRVNVPSLSTERRQQLASQAKKMAEEQKVVLRNTRRDANKHADELGKSNSIPEDDVKVLKDEIQELLKKYETQIEEQTKIKTDKIMEV
jgi:ribosome recycling factor